MLTLLSLLGGLLAAAFVLAPLRHPRRLRVSADVPASPANNAQDLIEQREAVLATLAELDFDRALGNLSEADYGNLRGQYRAQALGVLKNLDLQFGAGAATPAQPDVAHAPVLSPARGQAPPVQAGRRRAYVMGSVAAGLAGLALALVAVLASAQSPTAGADVPALPVLHVHAALLVLDTRVALVGHDTGLLRSTDDGTTWRPVAGVTGEVLALAGTPGDGSTVFLSGPGQVRRSRDAGLTWESLPLPQPAAVVAALAVGVAPSRPLYALVTGVGLFRSTGGGTWTLTGGGLPADTLALVLRPGNLSALYAASPSDGVLASSDEGRTWGSASGVVTGALPTLAVRALAGDPASGDQFTTADGTALTGALYVGTDLGLFKSIDGGTSWSPLVLTQPLVAVSARSVPTPLLLAVDSRGRVWRSPDRGSSWRAGP